MKEERWAQELLEAAREARRQAYAPYSGFAVGAALLCQNGQIFRGCNVENAAFGPSNCAERTAFFSAIAAGERSFQAIAIVGASGQTCPPCGPCRQVMREFCAPADFLILLEDPEGEGGHRTYTLEDLLPASFGPENLRRDNACST